MPNDALIAIFIKLGILYLPFCTDCFHRIQRRLYLLQCFMVDESLHLNSNEDYSS